MSSVQYQLLRDKAAALARRLPRPLFYEHHSPLLRRAEDSLGNDAFILKCRSHLDESQMEIAHGPSHCVAVARDAGVIVLVEAETLKISPVERKNLFTIAMVAGLLHDIKRREQDHAVRGSIEAEKILAGLGMGLRERQYVADAIRNHEAFQETFDRDDSAGRLISDALYDADKFRWGPENFSTTLWLMVCANNTPLEALHRTFREKMKGIEKIKETFRTGTGKRYGPEFIDQGILIGNAIYGEMSIIMERNR